LFVSWSLPRNGPTHHNIFVLEYMVVYSVTRRVIINFKYREWKESIIVTVHKKGNKTDYIFYILYFIYIP
jgi:hypothetical protein